MATNCKIAPSMMCADFLHLARDLDVLVKQKIEYLHIDVMDAHYVPNLTLGVDYCRALTSYCSIPLDVHLMVDNPDFHVPVFAALKPAMISFHPEGSRHPIRTLQLIRSLGCRAGIGIDPAMSLEQVKEMLPVCDMICVMTVSPGYAGQKLIPHSLDKTRVLADHIASRGLAIEIEVDGNVSWEHLPAMIRAGARTFVAGSSSLFEKGGDLGKSIERFRTICGQVGDRG